MWHIAAQAVTGPDIILHVYNVIKVEWILKVYHIVQHCTVHGQANNLKQKQKTLTPTQTESAPPSFLPTINHIKTPPLSPTMGCSKPCLTSWSVHQQTLHVIYNSKIFLHIFRTSRKKNNHLQILLSQSHVHFALMFFFFFHVQNSKARWFISTIYKMIYSVHHNVGVLVFLETSCNNLYITILNITTRHNCLYQNCLTRWLE